MRSIRSLSLPVLSLALAATNPALAGFPKSPLTKCAADAVVSGTVCLDSYEASVWRVPGATTTNKSLVAKIQKGKATVADLTAGGATPLGAAGDNYAPCTDNGQNCANDIYAVSLGGAIPSAYLSWFQAQAACKNSRKRLPSNAEWQAAVIGTPDSGPDNGTTDCNTNGPPYEATATGSRSACVSSDGAFDMVGNLYEWVADWIPRSTSCSSWGVGTSPTGDDLCVGGAATTGEPGALMRGGAFQFALLAGPFTINGSDPPSGVFYNVGFRCAR